MSVFSRKLFLLPFACILIFTFSCKQPLAPEYQGFEELQVGKLTMDESSLSTKLKFYNPNNFGIQLKKAEMDIFVNDKLADHYLLDTTIYISKLDTFYIPVSLKINFRSMFSNAIQALLNNQVKIRLAGYAKLKKGAVGFRVPLLYEQTEKLDALLK